MTDRVVRALRSFTDDIDAQFPDERGPEGQPSRGDFYTYDAFELRDRIAADWDNLPATIIGRAEYRVLIVVGRLGIRYSVECQLAPDGSVEMAHLDIDPIGLLDPETDDED